MFIEMHQVQKFYSKFDEKPSIAQGALTNCYLLLVCFIIALRTLRQSTDRKMLKISTDSLDQIV